MMIATREIITKYGKVKSMWLPRSDFGKIMDRELKSHYRLSRGDCKTIQLVAN
jgi:hypothetical protein